MSFFPPVEDKKPRELIPAKVQEAYCYGVVDLGTQERKPYMGKPKDPQRALVIFFEFTEELRQFKEDGPMEPMVKSQKYSYFTDEKSALAKLCASWLGKKVSEVDFEKLAGTPASISIVHEKGEDGKVYDNMGAIAPLSEKLVPLMPPMHNPPMNFSINEHGFESKEFEKLYEWVKETIKKSAEYKEYLNGPHGSPTEAAADDIPF
jgi:hypothetical protein